MKKVIKYIIAVLLATSINLTGYYALRKLELNHLIDSTLTLSDWVYILTVLCLITVPAAFYWGEKIKDLLNLKDDE